MVEVFDVTGEKIDCSPEIAQEIINAGLALVVKISPLTIRLTQPTNSPKMQQFFPASLLQEKKVLYLSKILIKPYLLKNPYNIHRIMWGYFLEKVENLDTRPLVKDPYSVDWFAEAENLEGKKRNFLFRVEWPTLDQKSREPVIIYLLSKEKPLSHHHFEDPQAVVLQQTKVFQPRLKEGDVLQFALFACPSKYIIKQKGTEPNDRDKKAFSGSDRNQEKKIRVSIIDDDDRIEWLKKHISDFAKPLNMQVNYSKKLTFRKKDNEGKFIACDFTGIIKVTHPFKLMEKLIRGVGPEKSFGCGLMLLAKS